MVVNTTKLLVRALHMRVVKATKPCIIRDFFRPNLEYNVNFSRVEIPEETWKYIAVSSTLVFAFRAHEREGAI